MKQMNAVTRGLRTKVFGPAVASFLALAVLTNAPAAGAQVTVAAGNGTGAPGGTASVTMTLTGGGGNVATVGFDVLFDTSVLGVQTTTDGTPTSCTLAPRLAATHTLEQFLPEAGRLRLGVFDLVPPLNTFADGDLATCTFDINSSAVLGTTSQLTMVLGSDAVSDNSVPPVVLPSTGANGAIDVSLVTPTAVLTNTPTNTPTNTANPTKTVAPSTNTPTPTNTVPPNTPTRTNTPGSTATVTVQSNGGGGSSGCTIAAPNSADASPLAWVLAPAVALLWRRRARR